jgi:DUF1680 family protein
MLAWRLLLATGDPTYADAIERTIYNGVLSGLSRSGTEFFYVNPLQVRTRRTHAPAGHERRAPWQFCACCPPNLMRMLSSWQQYLATADETGVQLHQYATSTISSSGFELAVQTSYPWDGRVTVDIVSAPERTWTLALRVPQWCTSAVVAVGDADPVPAAPGVFSETRAWRAGDRVVLDLDLAVRQVDPDPRVDAVRGCVAFERGPIVYCVESVDLPGDLVLEDLYWDPSRPPGTMPRPDLGDNVIGLSVPVAGGREVSAIPYYAWANRGVGGMRVWIPR